MNKRALKAAFPLTLPVLAGYLFLGLGFGAVLGQAGYGPGWAFLMSASVYAGAMQYVTIDLLVTGAGLLECALMTLLVNSRHLFYGLTMAQRYRDSGARKPYLAFSLTDETFALLSLQQAPEGIDDNDFCMAVSVLNHSYWAIGSLLGGLVGAVLPFDLTGIEFSMTALFVVMLTEQWRRKSNRPAVLLGLAASLFCLLLLGPGRFTAPALFLITGLLLVFRKKFTPREEAAA